MSQRFSDSHVNRPGRYSLGNDNHTGRFFLSIPVANSMIDYEEYYALSEAEYARFVECDDAALGFANACRARDNDDRLILKPGTDRGTPV